MRKAALEAAFSFLFRRFAVSDLTSRGQIADACDLPLCGE